MTSWGISRKELVRQVDKGSIVRHGFMSTLHKVESFGKGELQLKKNAPVTILLL